MGDVVPFTGITCLDEPPEQLLDKAKSWGMEKCIIVGLGPDNELIMGGSFSELPLIHYLLAQAQKEVLEDGS